MKDNKNWRVIAKRFKDSVDCIEEIRDWVPDDVNVGIDYADKNNPVIKLYSVHGVKPFAEGKVGDYVVMYADGRFDILPEESNELIEFLKSQGRKS